VWRTLKGKLAEVFRQRTRAEWCEALEGSDACFAPVLSLSEAPAHAHNLARGAYVDVGGRMQNAPAPRFSRTQPACPQPPAQACQDLKSVLSRWSRADAESGDE